MILTKFLDQTIINVNKILSRSLKDLAKIVQDLFKIIERPCQNHGKILPRSLKDLVKIMKRSCQVPIKGLAKISPKSCQDLTKVSNLGKTTQQKSQQRHKSVEIFFAQLHSMTYVVASGDAFNSLERNLNQALNHDKEFVPSEAGMLMQPEEVTKSIPKTTGSSFN